MCLVVAFACALLALGLLVQNSSAQSSTVGDVGNGLRIYEQRCASCHGAFGEGDGPMAAQAVKPPTPIGSAEYLHTAIPNNMFDTISNGRVEAGMPPFGERSSNPLSEQERWDIVAAMYAVGSNSAELPTAIPNLSLEWQSSSNQTISEQLVADGVEQSEAVAAAFAWRLAQTAYVVDDAVVRGTITNDTTGEPVPNVTVNLLAFEKFNIAQSFSAETNEQGEYEVRTTAYADWILRAEMAYNDLEYASDFVLVSAETPNPTAANITVFDSSDNSNGMMLNNLHTVVNIINGAANISQLYSFSNFANTVYIGGVPLGLPEGARNANFNIISGGNQLFPADSVEQTESGWRDTQPIPPGAESATLLVRYSLPADEVIQLAHNVALPTDDATLVLPADFDLSTADGWLFQASENFDGRQFATYVSELRQGFSAELTRSTEFAFDSAGNRVRVRDAGQELLVGMIGLGAVIMACAYLLFQWQRMAPTDPTTLLQEIAALDDAFAAKQIKKAVYETRRRQLMQQLKDIWTLLVND